MTLVLEIGKTLFEYDYMPMLTWCSLEGAPVITMAVHSDAECPHDHIGYVFGPDELRAWETERVCLRFLMSRPEAPLLGVDLFSPFEDQSRPGVQFCAAFPLARPIGTTHLPDYEMKWSDYHSAPTQKDIA